ncbi:hypothetical protein OBBRIDRAFT_816934 [Obba rivulosa]|uniref:DUF4604 domain-containing protein n=1 Tax=Obba rivulosa TaxID=1052685 RepID=A0A8E2J570_9APHY|nr:hypothetical protein OBBRIDRAFT_816934 [Obba rivulosa]
MSKSREPTRAQLSSRLSYSAHVPTFLQRMQAKVAGGGRLDGDDDDEGGDDEVDEFGRERVRARPPVPERPEGDVGSADEDDEDERPQVVVLREGKHLTELEAENERRKAKGLPSLTESSAKVPDGDNLSASANEESVKRKSQPQSLSFSSGKSGSKRSNAKRKAVGDAGDESENDRKPSGSAKKKPKKAQKKLLSFGDEA